MRRSVVGFARSPNVVRYLRSDGMEHASATNILGFCVGVGRGRLAGTARDGRRFGWLRSFVSDGTTVRDCRPDHRCGLHSDRRSGGNNRFRDALCVRDSVFGRHLRTIPGSRDGRFHAVGFEDGIAAIRRNIRGAHRAWTRSRISGCAHVWPQRG